MAEVIRLVAGRTYPPFFLMSLLCHSGSGRVQVEGINGRYDGCTVRRVEREDGSGRKFNIYLTDSQGVEVSLFVRVAD